MSCLSLAVAAVAVVLVMVLVAAVAAGKLLVLATSLLFIYRLLHTQLMLVLAVVALWTSQHLVFRRLLLLWGLLLLVAAVALVTEMCTQVHSVSILETERVKMVLLVVVLAMLRVKHLYQKVWRAIMVVLAQLRRVTVLLLAVEVVRHRQAATELARQAEAVATG